jgi:hypothetical protein
MDPDDKSNLQELSLVQGIINTSLQAMKIDPLFADGEPKIANYAIIWCIPLN